MITFKHIHWYKHLTKHLNCHIVTYSPLGLATILTTLLDNFDTNGYWDILSQSTVYRT